jgi:hypothetical protein
MLLNLKLLPLGQELHWAELFGLQRANQFQFLQRETLDQLYLWWF